MYKKILLILLLGLFQGELLASTELKIRAQDSEILSKRPLPLKIPPQLKDGPEGFGIKVVTSISNRKAIRDENGNFLVYKVNQKNRLVSPPKVTLTNLKSPTGKWPPTLANLKIEKRNTPLSYGELEVEKDKLGYYVGVDGYYYSLPHPFKPHHLPLPLTEVYGKDGKRLRTVPIENMTFYDSVSCYGIVWNILRMYVGDFEKLYPSEVNIPLASNQNSVEIYPFMTKEEYGQVFKNNYDQNMNNAFYAPQGNKHLLCFFPMNKQKTKYTSQSHDVVAHEAGHLSLNLLSPDFWNTRNREARAFHESFGDMTAIFSLLSFKEIRKLVLKETNRDLGKPSFLSRIGENIVDRDASELIMDSSKISCEEHSLSRLLTNALYGALAETFTEALTNKSPAFVKSSDQENLDDLTTYFRRTLIWAIKNLGDPDHFTFGNLGLFMYAKTAQYNEPYNEPFSALPQKIKDHFRKQGIDIYNPSPVPCMLNKRNVNLSANAIICSTLLQNKSSENDSSDLFSNLNLSTTSSWGDSTTF